MSLTDQSSSVASGQFDDADINVSESSFLDEYVTVDPSVDISSVDVVIDRVRAVTLRVPIVIEGDYLNAVIDTGAEVTVMSQEKFLKIPENRRPQIYKAERNLVVAEAGKKMQTLGMADVSCQIGPLDFIWSVYIAPIGDELLLGCDIIDEHDITINTKRGLEIKGQWINCDVTRRSDKVARVVLKEAVTIPANSEVILPGLSINSEKLDSRYCSVEPVFEDERQIIVARSLVDPYKETIPVRIVNVEKYPIRILKNYLLGELHPVEQFEVFIDNNADVELYDSVLYKDFCIGMSQGDLIDTPVIPENWRSPKVLSTKTDSFEIEAEIPKLPDFLSELYQKSCEKISDQEQKLKLAKVLLKNQEDHFNKLDEVLGRLQNVGLKLKPSKCEFIKDQVLYLGHTVSKNGISPNPKIVESVSKWQVPNSVKEVQQFLGLCNYYRQFVHKFSEIASPLSRLTRKDVPFNWSSECQSSFEILRKALCEAPILAYPLPEGQFILDTDASNIGIGSVLSQIQNGKEKVIAYGSKKLDKPQQRYSVTRRELLAVITFIHQFRHYLVGRKFLLRSDHASLRWLFNFKDPQGQLARWLETLSQYNFDIQHRPGVKHQNADSLSRREYDLSLCDHIKQELEILNKRLQPTGESYQLLVPKVLRKEVMTSCHNTMYSAHFGVNKTKDKIKNCFHWYKMGEDIQSHVNTCSVCNRFKALNRKPKASLHSYTVGYPLDRVAIDVIGPLPYSRQNNKFILVIGDHFTRWMEAFPLPHKQAEKVAEKLVHEFISRFGIPLNSTPIKGEILRVKFLQKPCSNGIIERFNATLEGMIRSFVNKNANDWDLHIGILMAAYRSTVHPATEKRLKMKEEEIKSAERKLRKNEEGSRKQLKEKDDLIRTLERKLRHKDNEVEVLRRKLRVDEFDSEEEKENEMPRKKLKGYVVKKLF
ncbi:Retrovirus-related Pol polyprotein from transposon 297 [Mytilus edulis]|uniref:RNA-directed DNA polymerase n=1 Tax=Mytilus edulis TaxID=6550 RepID=A0A8S3SEW3_MYTED|nr:Retrovirus-related Pol polyprotein from transposon 297 [Mytilus edulis]